MAGVAPTGAAVKRRAERARREAAEAQSGSRAGARPPLAGPCPVWLPAAVRYIAVIPWLIAPCGRRMMIARGGPELQPGQNARLRQR